MEEFWRSLDGKQRRTLQFAYERLFTAGSWVGKRDQRPTGMDLIRRSVRKGSKHLGYLSPGGMQHLRTLVTTIDDRGCFSELAGFSDVWAACKDTVAELMAAGQRPDTVAEFLDLVSARVSPEVRQRTFVIPMYGVELDGLDRFDFGAFRLVRPSASLLRELVVDDSRNFFPIAMEQMGKELVWFLGTVRGTFRTAERQLIHQARLAAGLFAISAASTYQEGANKFRIGAVASPEEARAPSGLLLHFCDLHRDLGFTRQMRQGQSYTIDSALAVQLQSAPVFVSLVGVLQKLRHNELEAALVRAVYWYADAHRDPSPVMRLVKFWTCIESFFARDDNITEAVSVGTAAVLVHGGFAFVAEAEYVATRKRLAVLYRKRSRALHHGMHDHVDERDLADLSQWAAWLVIAMTHMSGRYTQASAILAQCRRLDEDVRKAARQRPCA